MNTRETKRAVVLAGPTATGKSELAIAIAKRFGGVLINADSMQVYRDLRVLTARPSPEEEAAVPHRLYGVLPASESCSAARWRAMALAEIAAAHATGALPILVGGSGLYFRALLEGLSSIPAIPAAIREAARRRLEALGPERFHAKLSARDPETAARLAARDRQRMLRAWEVLEATGRPLSEWQREGAGPYRGPVLRLVLDPPRSVLYRHCDARAEAMFAAGAVAEVAALERLELDPELPAMKALGVPEIRAHLAGRSPLSETVRAVQQATRRYAKRQTTWFRHQMAGAERITEEHSEGRSAGAFAALDRFLSERVRAGRQ